MKPHVLAFCAIAFLCPVSAQQPAKSSQPPTEKAASVAAPRSGDVDSVDHVIAAVYDVISGPSGSRDWDRLRSLFHPDARMISSGRRDGKIVVRYRSVDEYIKTTSEIFAKQGFYERGIHNEVEKFDHMAQVWSTYESRYNKDDAKPFVRGINSFQLFYDGTRWWVINVYWQNEDASDPIPAKYLP